MAGFWHEKPAAAAAAKKAFLVNRVGDFGFAIAIFWMWVTAFLGMASAFVESTLAQLFKVSHGDGTFRGGRDDLRLRYPRCGDHVGSGSANHLNA